VARPRKPRVRQHANPLSHREPLVVPDWAAVLANPDLPREVDVGCAHGAFLLGRARARPDLNLIGLELRGPMVERVNRRIAREGVPNATVVQCNANASLRELFGPRSLQRVYVHFPDPWFKTRHRKRRVVTPELLATLTELLVVGGELRFMTDYRAYAERVLALLARTPALVNPHGPGAPAPPEPDAPRTHREEWHAGRGDPVYRYVWRLEVEP